MINTEDIVDSIVSHALNLGVFEQVNFQTPTNTPDKGLSMDVTVANITPIVESGLNSVSVVIEFNLLIVTHLIQSPENQIDKSIINAVDLLLTEYCNNITFNNELRNVDIFGSSSSGISANFGYIEFENTRIAPAANTYRAATITLPLIVNDVWDEGDDNA